MDLQKPVSRGRTINVMGNKLWIRLTFKKLPRISFGCGRIIHFKGSYREARGPLNNSSAQYGPWLRAALQNRAVRDQAMNEAKACYHNVETARDDRQQKVAEQLEEMVQKSSKNHEEIFKRLVTQNRPDSRPASTHILVTPEMENVKSSGEQWLKNQEHMSEAKSTKMTGQDHTSGWAEPTGLSFYLV